MPRTRQALDAALDALDVEHTVDLQPGYLGEGLTWCNKAAYRASVALGVPLPKGMLANDLFDWLSDFRGAQAGWAQCTRAQAVAAAAQGVPALAVVKGVRHGHIATFRPDGTICQAGGRNHNRCTLEVGFGQSLVGVRFFVNHS